MLGLSFDKLLIIGVIAVFVVGPKRLPTYAAKLATFIKSLRAMADNAKVRMREEMGPEFEDVDWKKLDPRQYDPRRIIREALLEEPETRPVVRPAQTQRPEPLAIGAAPPFDTEAT